MNATAPAPEAKTPADVINGRLRDLLVIGGHLTQLLEKENQALKDHRHDEVRTLFEEKDKLTRAWESRMKSVVDHAGLLADTDPDLREHLQLLGHKVDAMISENALLLQTAIRAGKILLDNIAKAVRSVSNGSMSYSTRGTYGPGARKAAARGVSVSLDREL